MNTVKSESQINIPSVSTYVFNFYKLEAQGGGEGWVLIGKLLSLQSKAQGNQNGSLGFVFTM